ncbi:MAG: nucleotidyl transferase AbiEii/AbiGii toxin family protein [Candidatus Omnitrophica bacterium]|nr:nucleotidyl transferase AbiEii/AbiGii toxin family protein [Candidatus Omnitrophota bacterium]
MDEMINQERFEIEVLDKLNTGRFLSYLAFCGGTMMRLCYGLDRFSVDIDFRILKKSLPAKNLFTGIKKFLGETYRIKDSADKFNTLLYEIGSDRYRRGLKIEIRKTGGEFAAEQAIAYSPYSDIQVLLNTFTLKDMMSSKIEAFLDRGEIRDAFDIEFLLKKGLSLNRTEAVLEKIGEKLDSLTEKDFKIKLFPLIEAEKRQYYLKNGFKILRMELGKIKTPHIEG